MWINDSKATSALNHCLGATSDKYNSGDTEQTTIQKSIKDSSELCVSMPGHQEWFTVKGLNQIITDMA